VRGGEAHLQSGGNNNAFNYLKVSKLKLTNFQEKSGGSKSLILAPRLVLQAEGAGDCLHNSSSWGYFWKPTYKNLTQMATPPKDDPELKHPEWIPPKAIWSGGATFTATQPSISTLRRDRGTKKTPVKGSAPGLGLRGKSPDHALNWEETHILP
jgi:hypothetical protein